MNDTKVQFESDKKSKVMRCGGERGMRDIKSIWGKVIKVDKDQ